MPPMLGVFLIFPAAISVVNAAGIFCRQEHTKTFHAFALITLIGGALLSAIYISYDMPHIVWKDWYEQLYNSQKHSPIFSEGILPLTAVAVSGLLGYLVLSSRRAYETPPLLIVLCMSAMYLWGIVCIVWIIQLSGPAGVPMDSSVLPLTVLPANCLLIILREIRIKILEWNSPQNNHEQKEWTGSWNELLHQAELWPSLALAGMLPILGVIMCVLALFGQTPDIFIRAFTETADWRLSEKIGPPNLEYDEHYLCTVAAGGHRKIVRPLRMGQRHGHRVIVNRQLQIANAFEQILEERTPGLHRRIRRIYDTYGLPIARLISTKWACDIVYLMMKPLEWAFLFVLYLSDIHPEDRIARQYLPGLR